MSLTRHHECELEALLDGLPVDLVGEVGKAHVARRVLGQTAVGLGVRPSLI